MIRVLLGIIDEFRSITLYGADDVRAVEVNFIFVGGDKLFGKAEVCNFDIHFLIKENVLCFDVAMSEPFSV